MTHDLIIKLNEITVSSLQYNIQINKFFITNRFFIIVNLISFRLQWLNVELYGLNTSYSPVKTSYIETNFT